MKPSRIAALALLALAALSTAAVPTQATANNPGTIKVHDAAAVEPPQRNQPHVTCDFFIEGFNMADTSGTLVVWSWPPTGDKSVVLQDNWTGTPEADGNGDHFLNGPYNLPVGHYRVEAFSSTGHPGDNEHFSKAKEFWVDGCSPICTENCQPCESDCHDMTCPADLSAQANADGSVTLTFTPAPGSDGTNVYRASGGGDPELIATVPAGGTTFTDTGTTVGTAYTYGVTGLFGDRESTDCPVVEVTSIPEFPTLAAMSLASVCGLAAYVVARRKA